eukprot:TRINITY_DN2448_c0_g1_i1.p1 TRINITY_DN2448_c0_g1~~TRINITY_DN2448_c0_g1_i1.p1  ORF type:complete len:394 (+),score=121.83 TRINITY_DN2448_c0_g1_i1:124-1182(+)
MKKKKNNNNNNKNTKPSKNQRKKDNVSFQKGSRSNRKLMAENTLKCVDDGFFVNGINEKILMKDEIEFCIENTILYTPEDFTEEFLENFEFENNNQEEQNENNLDEEKEENENNQEKENKNNQDEEEENNADNKEENNNNNNESLSNNSEINNKLACIVEVRDATTMEAAYEEADLVKPQEGFEVVDKVEPLYRVGMLNFASAKNPGGGFLKGSQAQEECLARSSALYNSIITQQTYYSENKKDRTCLYTNHMIYSPKVPFFKDDNGNKLAKLYLLDVITAPAPNKGAARKKLDSNGDEYINQIFYERADRILRVAVSKKIDCLILGAFGCGVFRNDPNDVANIFFTLLVRK